MDFASGSDCNESTCAPSLGQEDPLGVEPGNHSSILAQRSPWTEEPGELQSMESQRVRHCCATNTSYATLDLRFPNVSCSSLPQTFTRTVPCVWKILVLFLSAPTFASMPPPSFRPQREGHLHGDGFLGHSTSLRPQCDTLVTTCHFLS